MHRILNTPAEVLVFDVDETLVRRTSGPGFLLTSVTACLPAALAEARATMELFLASSHSHDAAISYLEPTGIPGNLFTPTNLPDSLPSGVFRAVFRHHSSATDSALGKITAMYNVLVKLGIPGTIILEAIAGTRELGCVVAFGDSAEDRMAAKVFGFRHGDVTSFSDGHTLSSVVGSISKANAAAGICKTTGRHDEPQWLAARRPVSQGTAPVKALSKL